MRSGFATATLSVVVVGLVGCSGDDTADPSSTPPIVDDAVTTPPPTTVDVTVVPDRCETEPDPADYIAAEIPPAVRPCVVPAEVTVETIREGSGEPARAGDGVIYHFTRIRSVDGVLIDSSYEEGRPVNLPVVGRGAEIPGLDESLVGVRAGELLRIDIPGDQAYGDEPPVDAPDLIRPGDALTYVVDVQGIVPVVDPEDAPLDLELDTSIGATELSTFDLVEGEGRAAEIGTTVVINLLLVRGDNAVVLFNSWDQGSPLVIPLDPALMEGPEPVTLPGIFEGLQGATAGTRRILTLPPGLAWGPEGQPQLGLPSETDVIVIADVLAVY